MRMYKWRSVEYMNPRRLASRRPDLEILDTAYQDSYPVIEFINFLISSGIS